VKIVALEERHIPSLLRLQSTCPEVAQWKFTDYHRVLSGDISGWVAQSESTPANSEIEIDGFVVVRRVAAEIEILNFAVAESTRRRGVGSGLLLAVLAWSRPLGAKQVMLEVRASNKTALQFYRRHDFQIVGRRPRYYSSPVDDALLLTAFLE
jgi:ribosomal protein S18 acetylase RimI-like enzyme